VKWSSIASSFVGFAILAALVIGVLSTLQNPNRPSPNPRPAPYPTTTPRPQVLPGPASVDAADDGARTLEPLAFDEALNKTKADVDAIVLDVAQGGHDAIAVRLPALRADAKARVHDPADTADSAFRIGWQRLAAGELALAERFFLHAIQLDPDNPDAWYGYALLQPDWNRRRGASTVAMLLYPDIEQAQARYDVARRDAWPKLRITREEMASNFDYAIQAEAQLRLALAEGTLAGPREDTEQPVKIAGRGPQPALPYPEDGDLRALQSRVDAIALALYQADASGVGYGMDHLHEEQRARRAAWAGKPVPDPVVAPVPVAFDRAQARQAARQPFDARLSHRVGWQLLERREFVFARRFLLQAIWADPADADAWIGYGLTQSGDPIGRGAIAMGLLLDQPGQVERRRLEIEDLMAPPPGGQVSPELEAMLDHAENIARLMRPRVRRGALQGS
jgi:tetratricopeptide (TPR) repeat protein